MQGSPRDSAPVYTTKMLRIRIRSDPHFFLLLDPETGKKNIIIFSANSFFSAFFSHNHVNSVKKMSTIVKIRVRISSRDGSGSGFEHKAKKRISELSI